MGVVENSLNLSGVGLVLRGILDSLQAGDASGGGAPTRHVDIPATAVQFQDINSSVIDETGTVQISAGVSSKKKWITHLFAVNIAENGGEIAVIKILDDAAFKALIFAADSQQTAQVGGINNGVYTFGPPLEFAAGNDINGIAVTLPGVLAEGESLIAVYGYVEI